MSKKIVAGNWKMYKTTAQTRNVIKNLIELVKDKNNTDIIIFPPLISIQTALEEVKETNIQIGAQNLFWEKEGAFTGEISAYMLKKMGCKYALIGHSERRHHFNETNEMINKKVKASLKENIVSIICIGETLQEKESIGTEKKCSEQLNKGLIGISTQDAIKIVIAYEPIWAIGTGKTATSQDTNNVCVSIRKEIAKMFSEKVAENIRILYGGSVNSNNYFEIMKMRDINGVLVGKASLNANEFSKIIKLSEN